MKRLFDIVASGCGLLVLSPVLILVAIWIKLDSKGPVFYRQVRVGRHNKDFRIFKFRSMRVGADKGSLVTIGGRDPRITHSGYFIRKFKIDELPQLINVLKGDMSLIGPRPLPKAYLPYYTTEEAHRHDVRPGISGWAQVNGRKNITWDKKLECDVYYEKNISLLLDIKILFLTVYKVVKKESVGVESSGTVSLYDTRDVQRPEYIKK